MKKYIFLGLIGTVIYLLIELMFRGYTSWLSGVQGFICFLFIGGINEKFSWETPFYWQMLIGGVFVTLIEIITGLIFNVGFGMQIWDYSTLPLSFCLDQGNLIFSFFWVLLSGIGIVLDDYIRYWFFKEEKPRYKFY